MQFANRKPPGTTLHRETHITHKPAFVGQLMLGYIVYFQVVKKLAADSHIQTEICTGRMEFLWLSVYLKTKKKKQNTANSYFHCSVISQIFPPLIRQSLHTGIKRLNLP